MFVIIIPYRDNENNERKGHLDKIIPHMIDGFRKLNYDEYKILVVEQTDDGRKFNRGSLLNIGFKLSLKFGSDRIIVHDVDLLPDIDMLKNYIKNINNVCHYARHKIKKYNYPDFFGAVNGFTNETYEKINGFSNCFWGWGGEDDAIRTRLKINKYMKIGYPNSGKYEEIDHGHDKTKRFDKSAKRKLMKQQYYNWRNDGLKQVKYLVKDDIELDHNTRKVSVHIIQNCYHINNYDMNSKESCEKYTPGHAILFEPILDTPELMDSYIHNVRKEIKLVKNNVPKNKFNLSIIEKKLNNKLFVEHVERFKQTYDYVMNVLHKGIYVRIKDNKISAFHLLINRNPKNNWSRKLGYDKNMITNNCLIENADKKTTIWESVYPNFFFLLKGLCNNRKINDCEFFYNKRDFPVLRKNLKSPHIMIYKENEEEDFSKLYKHMIPILSSASGKDYLDIPMPTPDDIGIVFKKYFPRACQNTYMKGDKIIRDTVLWKDKINCAVFRGKATGCGTLVSNNQRLKLSEISEMNKKKILDAGVTKWNYREKYYYGKKHTINKKNMGFKNSSFMSREEQLGYKYLISVDGHSRPYRLAYELMSNSLVIMIESKFDYNLFYEELLKPYEHYVPVKKDLSDLIEQIEWCISNDEQCQKIVRNANNLMKKVMTKDYFYDYVQYIINSL
jgi:hypothetical protein